MPLFDGAFPLLYRLEIENFYSVKLPQILDLRVGENVPDAPQRLDPLFPGSPQRAARVISLFGPNASGKSTVFKALAFITWFVQHSFQLAPNATLPCERFNDSEGAEKPIRLAAEFSGPMDSNDQSKYGIWRYELIMSAKSERIIVVSETLRQKPEGKGKWTRVVERYGSKVKGSDVFSLSGYAQIIDKVRDNASLISTLAQFDHKLSLGLREAAASIIPNIWLDRSELQDEDIAKYYSTDQSSFEKLNQEIQRIDLGIRRMNIVQSAVGPVTLFEHEGLQNPMPWSLESHGTRNFIRYFPLINTALERGGLALIDEIDIAIHPIVLPEIVGWFHDPERNPKKAQLWMTCHAPSLLEELLKEEIFFCEKDSLGRTSIYSLQDIKSVRRTDNRYRKYLSGVYGAIPQIG